MIGITVKEIAILTFTLIYFIFGVHASSSTIHISRNKRIDTNNQFVFADESINSQYLVYAICDYHKWCEIYLKPLTSFYGYSTYLSLEVSGSYEAPRLIPLSEDRIIVIRTIEETVDDVTTVFVSFTTVMMRNCSVVEHKRFKSSSASHYSVTPLDEKRYDVVAMDQAESFCRWEFDTEKNNVSGPFACLVDDVMKNKDNLQPIHYYKKKKGYVITSSDNQHWIQIDNKKILTKTRPVFGGDEVVTSTANDKISICWTENSATTCWQYDALGQLVNNVTIVHDVDFGPGSAVYNLKSGGLIVAVGLCEEGCANHARVPTYYVSRYNEQGRRMRMTIIRDFICNVKRYVADYKVALKFYENKEGKTCLALVCYGTVFTTEMTRRDVLGEYIPKLDVTTECFD